MSKEDRPKLPERPERYADWPQAPYWPTFIEKFLLTIIDAHPDRDEHGDQIAGDLDRRERLEKALRALLNIDRDVGNEWIYQLPTTVEIAREALPSKAARQFENFMMEAWREEAKLHGKTPFLAKDRTKPVSIRKSAEKHEGSTTGASAAARATRLRKELTPGQAGDYLECVVNRFHPEEEDMARDLRQLQRILDRWNVPMKIDAHALAMASLWSPKPPQ